MAGIWRVHVLPLSVEVDALESFDGSSTRFSSIEVKGPSRRYSIILVNRLVYVSFIWCSCKRFWFHVSRFTPQRPCT